LRALAGIEAAGVSTPDVPDLRFLPLRGRVTHVRPASHSLVVKLTEIPRELANVIESSLAHPERGETEAVIVE